MEKDQQNIGKLTEEYTARWLFKRGTDADPNDVCTWQAWALMELEQHDEPECQRLLTEGLRQCSQAPELVYLQQKLAARQKSEAELATAISALLDESRSAEASEILKDAMFRYPKNEEFTELYVRWRNL